MANYNRPFLVVAETIFATNAAQLVRGDLVVLTPASGSTPASIAMGTKANATHFLALGEVWNNGARIPTDLGNYNVAETITRGAVTRYVPFSDILRINATGRNVALYPIDDINNIVFDADGFDVGAAVGA